MYFLYCRISPIARAEVAGRYEKEATIWQPKPCCTSPNTSCGAELQETSRIPEEEETCASSQPRPSISLQYVIIQSYGPSDFSSLEKLI